jgi:hypothetical protein
MWQAVSVTVGRGGVLLRHADLSDAIGQVGETHVQMQLQIVYSFWKFASDSNL